MAKNRTMVAMGRKGGKAQVRKGIMANMTPEERSAYARKLLEAKKARKELES